METNGCDSIPKKKNLTEKTGSRPMGQHLSSHALDYLQISMILLSHNPFF